MRPIFWDETETEKLDYENSQQDREKVDADFFNETRLSDFFMSETRLNSKIPGETETRPRVSVSFFTRPRREPNFNEEICCIFG